MLDRLSQVKPGGAIWFQGGLFDSTRLPFGRTRFRFSRRFRSFRPETMSRWIPDQRIQPVHNIQSSARMFASSDELKGWSDANQSAERRQNSEDSQWHPHRSW